MTGNNHNPPGLSTILGRMGRLALRGLQNRVELMAVEWQEERLRIAELLFRAIVLIFLATMGALLLTVTVIFLFPAGARIYVTAGLALLYLLAAAGAWAGLKAGLNRERFSESIDQLKKDKAWLESLR